MIKDYFDKIINSNKVQQFKWRADCKIRNGKRWVSEHREESVGLLTIVVTGLISMIKMLMRQHNTNKVERSRHLRWYDNQLGQYWILRRPLSNEEKLKVDKRHRNGESYGDILESMKVLK